MSRDPVVLTIPAPEMQTSGMDSPKEGGGKKQAPPSLPPKSSSWEGAGKKFQRWADPSGGP